LVNADNPKYGTPGGNNTRDKVFLLSLDEIEQYMGDNSHVNIKNAKRAVDLNGDSLHWWLRSPGLSDQFNCGYIAAVDKDGGVRVSGGRVDSKYDVGVRPALWLDL